MGVHIGRTSTIPMLKGPLKPIDFWCSYAATPPLVVSRFGIPAAPFTEFPMS